MRRIYFLVPDLDMTQKVVDELRQVGIEDRHIHVLAKRGTPLGDLPEASLLQKSDFIPASERGVAVGGATGLLSGLVAVALPELVVGGGVLLGMVLAGAGVGSWIGGMVGMSAGNSRLKPFEEAIERGELLVLVDVPRTRIEEIRRAVVKHHADAEFEGIEPILPPPY